jgi:cell division protein FtsI/penicillin-binding protein 2
MRGRRVRSATEEFIPSENGATVVVTIDVNIQQRVEHHLRQAVSEFDAEWGAALVMDPRSGEVLASAVVPDFEPAQPIPLGAAGTALEAAEEHLRNRVIADAYEPGSIFKPFIAGPACDAGLLDLDQPIVVDGPVRYWGSRPIHDTHTYQTLKLYEVVGYSSNIGMGLVGDELGNERLHEYVRRFGFGDPTGVQLPGEQPGLLFSLARWTRFSTQSIPIGQEIAATPLQVLTAFLPFCNDGTLYRPRVVRGVIGADGQTRQDDSRPIAIRRVMSAAASRDFRARALRHVMTDGTGARLDMPEYAMFGKTGTAQIARKEGGGYEPGAYAGSFVCGAPLDDPRVAVLVSLYHPKGGKYYGGTVAGPAAARIVAETLTYMRVPHSPSMPLSVE